MDNNKRREQCDVFLKNICALLNSGGGVLSVKIANEAYDNDTDGLGEDLENGLNEVLKPERIQNLIRTTQDHNELKFHVTPWRPAERRAPLCTQNSGLYERSGTSVQLIAPANVMDLWGKPDQDAREDPIYVKAHQFYEEGTAHLNQTLDFGESATVELKSFVSEKKLLRRLREILPKYLSAFANTSGGFMFIGIDDKTKRVVGCGNRMTSSDLEKEIRPIINKAQSRALHMHQCPKQNSWSPEVKVFTVTPPAEDEKCVIAIKIPAFCCAVFAENPECWQMEGNKVIQLKCSAWLEKMQHPLPGNLLTGPASVRSEIFKKYPNTFTTLMTSGNVVMPQSCADDITKAAPIQTLMITPGEYLQLLLLVPREIALKQKRVNLRGYTGRICVIPHLVCCVEGEVIQNEAVGQRLYLLSYTLDSNEKITALSCSVATMSLSFTLPLEGTLRSEFLSLLTDEELIKVVVDFSLLCSGKTLLIKKETEIQEQINSSDCEPDSDLSVCENEALKALPRKRRLCTCEIIFDLMKDTTGSTDVEHII
ncbi:hypothetical protein MHYP_G00118650 [Metynnis hypsauchen]